MSSGSTKSVPEIAANIDVLLKNGLTFNQAKAKILASSDTHPKTFADGTKASLKVFNPDLLRSEP